MQQLEFKPLGRQVSCLGFGCARLDGRAGLRRSARLLETALELGISYFDVAAAYGTAEEAVGHVVGNSPEVVVASKVGPPRPPYHYAKMKMRAMIKPVVDRSVQFKRLLRKSLSPPRTPAPRPRYDFSAEAIEASLETSLKYLRRDRLDVLLAHEPHRSDLVPEVEAHFQRLVAQQRIGAYGVGIGAIEDRWTPFGSIWQSAWPGESVPAYTDDVTYIFHGVLKNAQRDRYDRTILPAADLVRAARRQRPDSVLIVSASTPGRLRELVQAVEQGD